MPENKNVKENLIGVTVQIPYELKNKLKFHAYKEDRNIKEIVRDALEQYLSSAK